MDIRKFEISEKKKVLDLFNIAFEKPIPEEVWEWRYNRNPFSDTKLIDLMWEDDILVGHYALWPTELIVDGGVIMSAMSMTTMTHPKFAGKGIFTSLAKSVYSKAFELGVKLVWGFPNLNSHYGFIKKLDWKNVSTIPMLSLSNGLERIGEEPYTIKTSFSDNDALNLQRNNQGEIKLNKSSLYLNWRYINNPMYTYQILSPESNSELFIVFKVFPSFNDKSKLEVDIVEWNVGNDLSDIELLISSMNCYLKTLTKEVYSFNTWMNIADSRHLHLERLGFQMNAPITFLGGLTPANESFNSLLDYRKWGLSMGDSDVF